MVASYVQPGRIINYTNTGSSEIAYGEVVILTEIIGVATISIPAGVTGTIEITGVYQLPTETTAAFTVGQTVYWDGSKAIATKPETDVVIAGRVVVPKAQSSATALIKLAG